MLVFEAVVCAGGGDRHAGCLISGEVSPCARRLPSCLG
jgi:hypothetical protein